MAVPFWVKVCVWVFLLKGGAKGTVFAAPQAVLH